MAIETLDQYVAAAKQRIKIQKTAPRTAVATIHFGIFDLAGTPSPGVLAGTNTANGGVCPTDETLGFPPVLFSTGVGYLSKIEFGSSVACRFSIFDLLIKMGAISYAAATTTPSAGTQPAISQRCPDYPGSGDTFGAGLELWVEVSTAFVSGTNWNVQVTYKNQAGVSGRTATMPANLNAAALTVGKMFMLTLQSGDTGVQCIESVIVTNAATVMTAGNFNVLILRPLWTNGRVRMTNDGDVHDILKTGMPIVYADSALITTVETDSNSTGYPELVLEIANG